MMYEPLIAVENLTKVYRIGSVDFPALDDVSLEIESGEFISIVGPSGSGKSTLLNIIGALDRPTYGRVLVEGSDLFERDENQLAEFRNTKLGFIFQAHNLLMRTSVLANVALPGMIAGDSRTERMERAREILEVVGLGDKITRKPTELSGGEQQRVAIARALINDPLIILGDEPTGNLDSKTGAEIVALMKEINSQQGTVFILVTHNPEVANETNRVIHLRDGRISEEVYTRLAEQAEVHEELREEIAAYEESKTPMAELNGQRALVFEDMREPATVADSTTVMPAVPTMKTTKFCRECGVQILRDSMYCEECGKKVA